MRVNGLTVCVNYSDLLEPAIPRWRPALDSLLVVTDLTDTDTLHLCYRQGISIPYATDAFYRSGAVFNKGAAMEEGRRLMPWRDWILFFDADIVPPANWKEQVESFAPRPGNLYGCVRQLDDGTLKSEGGEVAGFFQLFHSSDPLVQDMPLIDTTWRHAGGYDSTFMARWPKSNRIILPIIMRHQGPHGRNWCGRGNDEAMDSLMERRRATGSKVQERIT